MLPDLYWFVEAYAQIVLIWAGSFAWKPARYWAEAEPFGFGLLLLIRDRHRQTSGAACLERRSSAILHRHRCALPRSAGRRVHFARSRRLRLGLLIIAALLFPMLAYMGGNWTGSWVKFSMLLAATAILLDLPRLRLPRPLVQILLPVAAASYHIYLFHRILPTGCCRSRIRRSFSRCWR